MNRLILLLLASMLVLCTGCDGSSTEEPKEADTAADVGADADSSELADAPPDLAVDSTDVSVPDTSPDGTADAADTSPNCEIPGLRPNTGPSTGGTLVDLVGYSIYIGALSDWVIFGDEVLAPLYQTDGSICGLPFVTPPRAPGAYPVWAYYGDPSQRDSIMQTEPLGTFTVVASDEPIGHGQCSADLGCAAGLETCDLGLGRCVTDVCLSAHCSDTWQPGACDSILGCVDGCLADTDCKLLYSSCGCQAAPLSDPRTELTGCALGACVDCFANQCSELGITAKCVLGVCQEALP
ncbi:MAG: hypothetical protein AUK47_28895 [Deltaproteobacteria bacterium CG2_30_63_29]|nr:MAG: hypothetical protein AUK47_28895 [Deltaproteobacteria bacterium CG2_30_63_29]PJB38717.1 MAG: hypothetical protein CO108_18505 [Deltaproteobacteria bacterium CG_4_9_14_3_um_filter_63_12]